MKPTLIDRIQTALVDAGGRMTYQALAETLYTDSKSWRYQSNGGPPGCFMALSAAIRRGGFDESSRAPGPGNRVVYARKARS